MIVMVEKGALRITGAVPHESSRGGGLRWWLDEPQVQAVLLGIRGNVGYIVGWRRELGQRTVLVDLRSWSLSIEGLQEGGYAAGMAACR